MGTVLAMIFVLRPLAFLALCAGLMGCGNDARVASTNDILQQSIAVLRAQLNPPAPVPNAGVTRDMLDQVDASVMFIEISSTGQNAILVAEAVNRDAVTWLTANNIAVITKNGVLFGTRGFGRDLLAADTEPTSNAIRSLSARRYPRALKFLNGNDEIETERFFCQLENDGATVRQVLDEAYSATQFREVCQSLRRELGFQNTYWLDQQGVVRESRQWLSHDFGHIVLIRLTN